VDGGAFAALTAALGARGLNVWLPLDAAAFDAACAPVAPALRLEALLPGARGAVVVGSGGQGFFEGFLRAPEATDGLPNPLDRYTRAAVEEAARAALEPLGVAHVELFPFLGELVGAARGHLPFQRLGRAAGVGGQSPLGLQIHPVFGPWWAYRGLVVVDVEVPAGPFLGDACAGCPAPCVAACPAGAVRREGFDVPACHARRLTAEPCRLSCAARIACVRGPEHRYTDAQLAFHMRASMPRRSG
jgi:epoxyqueuosine reductase QueG